jgi:hypothetical protein
MMTKEKNTDALIFEESAHQNSVDDIIAEIENVSEKLEEQLAPEEEFSGEEVLPLSVIVEAEPPRNPLFTLSAGASLVFIAVVLMVSVFVTGNVLTAFYLSPVILIFIGAEVFYNIFRKRKARINPPDIILCALMITFTFLLMLVSVSLSGTGTARLLTQQRFAGEIGAKIAADMSGFVSLADVEVDVILLSENAESYRSLKDIKPSDTVTIRFYFSSVQQSLFVFATDCRHILDILSGYGLPLGNIEFYSVDRFNRLQATVNMRYNSDVTAAEIARMTNFYISDGDFDLVDFGEFEEE